MNIDPNRVMLPSLEAFTETFMEAAVASEASGWLTRWRRRLLGIFAGVVLLATGGVLVEAELSDESLDIPVVRPGNAIGYIDLSTHEPILCPDGKPLVYIPESNHPAPGDGPRCSDGSIPDVYREQVQRMERWQENAPAGAPIADGPDFAYELDPGVDGD